MNISVYLWLKILLVSSSLSLNVETGLLSSFSSTRLKFAIEQAKNKGLAEGTAIGLAEGRAEGKTQGIAEERASIARTMKADGVPVQSISKYTGLTAAEIEAL